MKIDIKKVLTEVMASQTVSSVAMSDAPKAATEVISAVQSQPSIALVQVKSGWTSKLNWKALASLAVAALALFGIDLTPAQQAAILGGLVAVSEVATIIIRTWFTTSVTSASMGKGS